MTADSEPPSSDRFNRYRGGIYDDDSRQSAGSGEDPNAGDKEGDEPDSRRSAGRDEDPNAGGNEPRSCANGDVTDIEGAQ